MLRSLWLSSSLMVIASGAALAQDKTTLTFTIQSGADRLAIAAALETAFEAANPDVDIVVDTVPGGEEGDNLVKTRLATGDMSDLLWYNTGSLFQALNPTVNFLPMTDQPFLANVIESFNPTVSAGGQVYGVPLGTAMGGGVLYNRVIYDKLGLSVPKTWAEFMANNAAILADGKSPVIQTFADAWTAQLFVLADYYNVQAAEPDFATRYTNNEVKYATSPAALAGFTKQEEVFKAGYLNPDYASAKFEDGIRQLALGEGAHFPMLTFAVATIAEAYPENVKDVGFFALPGTDAANVGLTTWTPSGVYVNAATAAPEAAMRFVAFMTTTEGCDLQTKAVGATGPYMVKGCTLPADVPQVVSDMLPYFAEGGKSAPALEFVSPIKGPNMPQITVEVGSGIRSAADAAAIYDEDVKKQAQQLGLPNW